MAWTGPDCGFTRPKPCDWPGHVYAVDSLFKDALTKTYMILLAFVLFCSS